MVDAYLLTLHPMFNFDSFGYLERIEITVREHARGRSIRMWIANDDGLVDRISTLIEPLLALGVLFVLKEGEGLTLPVRVTRTQLMTFDFPVEQLDRLSCNLEEIDRSTWN
jgi:hypothetical protein